MKLKPIINSLLENDLYKFSMGQTIIIRQLGLLNVVIKMLNLLTKW